MTTQETDLLADLKKLVSDRFDHVLDQAEEVVKATVNTLAEHGALFTYDKPEKEPEAAQSTVKYRCGEQGCAERVGVPPGYELADVLRHEGWSYIGRPPGALRCPEHGDSADPTRVKGRGAPNTRRMIAAKELRHLLKAYPADIRGSARRRLQERAELLEKEATEG